MIKKKRSMPASPGRPREIGEDWHRVESWFPPQMYAEIKAWIELRKELASRMGESTSKISIRTELTRAWAEFFRALPPETRKRVTEHPKYANYYPLEPTKQEPGPGGEG